MTSMIRRLSPFAAIAVAVASVAAGPTRHPASAETTLAAAVTLVPQPLAPQQWCRPVVSAAIDPAPLACWLTLSQAPSADVPMSLVGMNLGDLPPWGDIDIEGIGASLARYEQALEADRLAAEAAAKAAARRTQPGRSSGRTSGAGGEADAGPPPLTVPWPPQDSWVPEDEPMPEVDWEAAQEEHLRWIAEMDQRAHDQLNAQCPGGGSAGWRSDGTITVVCY
jgi:hypothetical protein